MNKPTILDLFSGIGGFSLAGHWAGFETVAFCEREPFCQKVLAKHWPEVPIFDDICTLTAESLRQRGVGRIDVITGGFPCQDLSIANKTAQGLNGKRSGLWFEMLRIIELARPAFVVIENVPNLYRMGIDVCLSGMESLGYAVRPFGIPACGAGAWHLRQRVFIVGTNTDRVGMLATDGAPIIERIVCNNEVGQCSVEKQSGIDIVPWTSPDTKGDVFEARSEEPVLRFGKSQVEHSCVDAGFGERSRLFEPKLCGDIHGIPNGLDRLRALGNSIVPQVAYPILKAIHDDLTAERER